LEAHVETPGQSVEALAYFSGQMAIHLTRILAANGVEERLRSAIRQTLAQGVEQMPRERHQHLQALADTFLQAVDGGIEDRKKYNAG
jgi:hypothetical protein